ncbi:MAG: sigma-54 dependent transcriptional regulator [Bacteroidales bacterium]
MVKKGTVLAVDDNKGILQALSLLLERYFIKVITINTPNKIDAVLRDNDVDVVLLDMNFTAKINTGNEGLYWLGFIKQKYVEVQVVVFTAYADINLAVEALKKGATDFVVKPWNNDKLIATITSAYNLKKSKSEVKQLKEIKQELIKEQKMFWGASYVMKKLQQTIKKVASTDANIIITGENGTGKEMLAREIHNLSKRSGELMITVDMGAIAETLFESELFGHVKGAFTDAHVDRAGKFEVATGGTLFLDEIGNLPLHLQAKLLTVLQSNKIVRVGSNKLQDINIRLICATNRNLEQMIANGTFREDLLYRINTIHVNIPSLRERKEDIIPLATIFLKLYALKYGKQVDSFSEEAKIQMVNYLWPGNIRELQHTVEKAAILCEGAKIVPEDIMLKPQHKSNNSLDNETEELKKEFATFEQMERSMIVAAMERHGGNLSAISDQLGITRQTLYNKIKKYNL